MQSSLQSCWMLLNVKKFSPGCHSNSCSFDSHYYMKIYFVPKINKQNLKKQENRREFFYLLEITSDGCHGNNRALVALCSPVNDCTSTSFTSKINNDLEFPTKPELSKTPIIRSKDVLWSHSADMDALFVLSARGMCTVRLKPDRNIKCVQSGDHTGILKYGGRFLPTQRPTVVVYTSCV